ncbi:MAG: crossover junction endodeoxyribonuclease RuvC [Stygiobacter sp.]|jgi:crossover junction endodeoxyribonuclease RuvC|uniref:Crossover junction endodeoxyribonuclease RuvC n=1 Tax=Stygiobacter electus TaxID=3032292 RepID=A0AAE3TC80_9BACT|nr:crossover junction endodeoxyribonuclease RuvC [Stygiobacter electus]MDF1611625.1 crossover junction endodeoxyribonuclease RuvC [Stygiobacter electus]
MRIIGIDPGTLFTGYGIIDFKNNEIKHVVSGVIKIQAFKEQAKRLEVIYSEINSIIKKYKPQEFALETAFYGKNVQSTLKIGYARGVSMLVAIHNKLPMKEYSPREVKKAVVGNGAASKDQVQFMIKKLLCLNNSKIKFDETDALAVAVCHAFKITSPTKRSKTWKEFVEDNPEKIWG